MLKNRSILSTAGAVSLLALLSGCHVGPPYHAPTPIAVTAPNYKESPVNFQDTGGWKVASPQDAMLRGNWWEVFNDTELNALEDQLNINNENLKQYFQNYMAARAEIAEARSQYWPTITAAPSWNRSKSSGTLSNSTQANPGKQSTLWNAPIDVSWTPDFWGKIRNEVREAEYASQVSAADLEVEKLTEQGSLAEYYFEIRGQDMLQQILNETVTDDQKSLDYNQAQYDTGVGDYISVVEAKTTLEAAQASATNVGLLRAQYEHAIAMLIGKAATDFSIPVKPMVFAPPSIPTGVPSQLVERRPDVAAAERTLAEANAVIGIGYAAFFPQVTISASGGFQSSTLTNLFTWPSRVWSIGPSVSQTIFDGWLYRAELHQYEAQYNADLANYRAGHAHRLPAGGRLSRRHAHLFATDPAPAACGERRAGISQSGNRALHHGRGSLCRRNGRREYAAQQPANAELAAGGGNDLGSRTGASPGRRMGPFTASHTKPGRRKNHQRRLQNAAVAVSPWILALIVGRIRVY